MEECRAVLARNGLGGRARRSAIKRRFAFFAFRRAVREAGAGERSMAVREI